MSEEIYTPYMNCGWKSAEDGCCSHPRNATPECHQFICPIHPQDPLIGIAWPLPVVQTSERDKSHDRLTPQFDGIDL